MKAGLLTLPLVCFTVLTFSAVSAHSQTLTTFDNLVEDGTGSFLPTSYQGLVWSNFWCNNAILYTNVVTQWFQGALTNGQTGNFYGMVSPSNVAYNAFGDPAEIDSPGTNFNFLSVYLAGMSCSNLSIEVEGFNGAKEIYDTIVVASATNATLFTFDYFNIDRLYFNSYGGEPAFSPVSAGGIFVMDNFMFEFIPEPSSLRLTALGAATLCAFLKRKRS